MAKPDLDWATEQVFKFLHLSGAPTEEKYIAMHAEALLRIVATNDEVEHPDLGKVRPGDWTVQSVLDSCPTRFPAPILFRRFHSKYWRPADGKFASELEAILNAQD
jgi:hypothetical protein